MAQPADLDKWAKDQGLPNLTDVASKKSSEFDPYYNCIAHAFQDATNWWWPTGLPQSGHDSDARFWPMASDNRSPTQAFMDWFAADGWSETTSSNYSANVQRIALYANAAGEPTHAARQIGPNLWSSKLGSGLDLSHAIDDLDGPSYGRAVKYFEKI